MTIITKYLGATNTKCARIRARSTSGISITIPFPYEKQGCDAHAVAAVRLAKYLGWHGEIVAAELPTGYAFTHKNGYSYSLEG